MALVGVFSTSGLHIIHADLFLDTHDNHIHQKSH